MKKLFLDLEDTVITPVFEGWANAELMNIQKVRGVISQFQPDEVHIFSFAIWDKDDIHNFNFWVRNRLELALGVNILLIPTVDDILDTCCKQTGIVRSTVDFKDLLQFWGKQDSFKHCVKGMKDCQVMLLDDSVMDESFSFPEISVSGLILNIDKL